MDLISRYLQLKYLASKLTSVPRNFNKTVLYDAYNDFIDRVKKEDDQFIKEELNPTVCDMLLRELNRKFPPTDKQKSLEPSKPTISMAQRPPAAPATPENYFFPNPAPLASANFIISNYKPALVKLGDIDLSLRVSFSNAGFKDQLHYYYDMDGYAMTTSLEKFNLDGSPVPKEKRFTQKLGGEGKFSYFEIFKSMFFELESEFRMFAFIVASKPAIMSNDAMTAGFADQILKNSSVTLPSDLIDKSLSSKVLSIFVYHFHQNDIGEVPELDLSRKLTVQDHLKNAELTQLIQ